MAKSPPGTAPPAKAPAGAPYVVPGKAPPMGFGPPPPPPGAPGAPGAQPAPPKARYR